MLAFFQWASVPGREVAIIDKIAPLVRYPLVRVCRPGDAIKDALKSLCGRSAVVKQLVCEALDLQQKVSRSNTSDPPDNYTPKKHKLLDSDEAQRVKRHKRRKLCTGDAVPGLNVADQVDGMMALI